MGGGQGVATDGGNLIVSVMNWEDQHYERTCNARTPKFVGFVGDTSDHRELRDDLENYANAVIWLYGQHKYSLLREIAGYIPLSEFGGDKDAKAAFIEAAGKGETDVMALAVALYWHRNVLETTANQVQPERTAWFKPAMPIKYKGVGYHRHKYRATLAGGKHVGTYDTAEEAARAHDAAAIRKYGPAAKTNVKLGLLQAA